LSSAFGTPGRWPTTASILSRLAARSLCIAKPLVLRHESPQLIKPFRKLRANLIEAVAICAFRWFAAASEPAAQRIIGWCRTSAGLARVSQVDDA
jgi:hypothetical protein